MTDTNRLDPSFEKRIPDGDDRERRQCAHCGFVAYDNPKIVTGVVANWGDRLLLARRAIEPRRGYWTIPAGYLELGESVEEGAAREAREEACAELSIDRVLAIYSVPHLSQTQIFYRATLLSNAVAPGPESLEVGLFSWEDIPWQDMAFPTAIWALIHHRQVRHQTDFAPFSNPDDINPAMPETTQKP